MTQMLLYVKLLLSVAVTAILGSVTFIGSEQDELELIKNCSRFDDDWMQSNAVHSRKKRFLAFPQDSSLTIIPQLVAPVSNVPGLNQLSFYGSYYFPLDVLFPIPIRTTTAAPSTTASATPRSHYGVPSTTTPRSRYGVPSTTTPRSRYGVPSTTQGYRAPGAGQSAPLSTPNKKTSSKSESSYSSYAVSKMDSPESFNRITFYELLEDVLASRGYNGHQCILRTLCEVADEPFDHGLFGEIINIMMSASMNPSEDGSYDNYMLAEYYGRHYGHCHKIYPKCPESVLGLVSGVN